MLLEGLPTTRVRLSIFTFQHISVFLVIDIHDGGSCPYAVDMFGGLHMEYGLGRTGRLGIPLLRIHSARSDSIVHILLMM